MKRHYTYHLLFLFSAVLLASALRFYKLGVWSYWIDEHYTISTALNLFDRGLRGVRISSLAIFAALNTWGIGEWSARLVPALAGILSVLPFYFLTRRMFNTRVASLASLLLVLSPWHIFWSQNARFYTVLMLFYMLASFAVYFGLEEDRPGYLLLSLLLLVLAAWERMIALFLVPVVLCYVILLKGFAFQIPSGLRLKYLAPVPLLIISFSLYQVAAHISPEKEAVVTNFFNIFVGNPNHHPLRFFASFVYQLGLPIFLLGLVGGIYLLVRKDRAGLFLAVGAGLPVLSLLLMSTFIFTVDRYLFVTLPWWLILSAVTVEEVITQAQGQVRILALGALLLLIADPISQDLLYYEYQKGNRPDWEGAYAYVRERKSETERVFSTRPELSHYYLDQDASRFNQFAPDEVVKAGQRVWFVIGEPELADPKLLDWVQENSLLVDIRDIHLPGKNLRMRVYLYDPLVSPLPAQ